MGKILSFRHLLVFLLLALVYAGPAAPQTAHEPVFFYLQADVTDHVNLDITEDRLRRLLPMLEKYRADHPQAHVSATVMFSGAVSDALAKRNAETHIVDFVKDYARRGVIEIGYDGADEPTYKSRPTLDFSNARNLDDRWVIRTAAADKILAQGRNPLTGVPEPGEDGGLKKLQEVFGEAAYVSGLAPMIDMQPRPVTHAGAPPTPANGEVAATAMRAPAPRPPMPLIVPEMGSDSEIVDQLRRYNTTAVMPGLPEDNPANLAGFGGSEQGFAELISPALQTVPEVYWQDNALRLSEVSNTSEAAAEAEEDFHGLTAGEMKEDMGQLSRTRMHVVRVELADERYYLQHAYTKDDEYVLKYAYDHPQDPKLPAQMRVSAADVDAAYAKEKAALDWLADDFFSANPGSRFVSNADLRQMAGSSAGYNVSIDQLRAALTDTLAKWGNNTFPPQFLRVGDRYLSLADLFQVMTDALAELDRTGKLPESVQVVQVWGPDHMWDNHGPNAGEVTPAIVARYCAGLTAKLHDASASAVPKNQIPGYMIVNGITINAAQFLRLMAESMVASAPDTKIRVKMTYMFPGQVQLIPRTRILTETGAMWTVKPAMLQMPGEAQSTQAQR